MFNWLKIREKNDLNWLVYGYNGFNKVEADDRVSKIWEDLLDQYEALVRNTDMRDYYELVADLDDMRKRHDFGVVLINQIAKRPFMTEETLKNYAYELNKWRFYINLDNDLTKEVDKIINQLKAVAMKIKMKENEKADFEQNSSEGSNSIRKEKVILESHLQRSIDFRITTVSEYHYMKELAFKKTA